MVKTSKTKIGAKAWFAVVIFGLFGQLAWMLENMYLNLFMDRTVSRSPVGISIMVGASAIVATITTLVMGTFSDKRGKRKKLISVGYIIWGLSVMLFGAVSVKNTMNFFNTSQNVAIPLTIAIIVFLDCLMTFFGSTANDAAFVSWVTDISDDTNRGTLDGVLAVMPLIAMGLILGAFDPLTQNTYLKDGVETNQWSDGAQLIKHGNWVLFFVIIGALVTFVGILGLFLVKDSPTLKPNEKLTYKDILYGFRKDVIKENKILYVVFLVICIIGIANNAYMPYLVIYIERTLEIKNYVLPVIIIGGAAAIGSVVLGILYDKFGKSKFIFPVFVLYVVGAVLMTIVSPIIFKDGPTPIGAIVVPGFLLMCSNLGIAALTAAAIKDLVPKDRVGGFSGVRMVFIVLIPMVIGPALTAILTKASAVVGSDEYGEPIYKYPPYMFLISAGVALLAIPFLITLYKYFKNAESKVVNESLETTLDTSTEKFEYENSEILNENTSVLNNYTLKESSKNADTSNDETTDGNANTPKKSDE